MASPQPASTTTSIPLAQAHTLLTSFHTFLTVAIHSILFYRHIYPRETFLSAKAYNLPVHQSRHPKLCAWIQDAVEAVAAQIAAGSVERVAVVLHASNVTGRGAETKDQVVQAPAKTPGKDAGPSHGGQASNSTTTRQPTPIRTPPAGAVLERWMFDVSRFPAWPGGAEAMQTYEATKTRREEEGEPDEEASEDGSADEAVVCDEQQQQQQQQQQQDHDNVDINWTDVDEHFRGVLRRLAATGERLTPLPPNSTFTVAVELRGEAQAPIGVSNASQPFLLSRAKVWISCLTRYGSILNHGYRHSPSHGLYGIFKLMAATPPPSGRSRPVRSSSSVGWKRAITNNCLAEAIR